MVAGAATPDEKDDLMNVWKSRDTCITCMLRVNSGERGITCDLCNRWYHKDCEKVSKKEYDVVSKTEVKLKWFCSRCEEKFDDMRKGYRKLEEKLEGMEGEVRKLRKEEQERKERVKLLEEQTKKIREDNAKCMRTFREDLDKVEHQMREIIKSETKSMLEESNKKTETSRKEASQKQEINVQALREELENIKKGKIAFEENEQKKKERRQEMEKLKEEVLSKGIEEIKKTREGEEKKVEEISMKIEELEKERRKKNLLIFNLEESNADEPGKRYQDDMAKCTKIFTHELEIQDLLVEKLIRMGKKQENRRRPLLVKLGSETDRNTILSQARKMRNSVEFERVYLAKDLTEVERETDRKLREELREKRDKEEGKFMIRRGKVIKIPQEGARKKETPRRQDF